LICIFEMNKQQGTVAGSHNYVVIQYSLSDLSALRIREGTFYRQELERSSRVGILVDESCRVL